MGKEVTTTALREALKAEFVKIIEEGADMPFGKTGVTMPKGKLWDRYAIAVERELLASTGE